MFKNWLYFQEEIKIKYQNSFIVIIITSNLEKKYLFSIYTYTYTTSKFLDIERQI